MLKLMESIFLHSMQLGVAVCFCMLLIVLTWALADMQTPDWRVTLIVSVACFLLIAVALV